jgi:F0F1-type ATP synthase assembly protein I
MFVIMISGWYMGDWADRYFGTEPTGGTIGFFVGLSAALFYVFREVYRLRAQLNEEDNADER